MLPPWEPECPLEVPTGAWLRYGRRSAGGRSTIPARNWRSQPFASKVSRAMTYSTRLKKWMVQPRS